MYCFTGWNDIAYSFLIGEDGRAYEGRGWGVSGAHTSGYNSVSHGISMIGTFTSRNPNNAALDALQDLIDCGVADVSMTKHNLLFNLANKRAVISRIGPAS